MRRFKGSAFPFSLTKTISITSGKGGVGKTSIVTNLAQCLAGRGSRVLILDGDLGMGNVDIMYKMRPKHTIYDVLKGEVSVDEVLLEVNENVFLIPGGSGIYEIQHVNHLQKQHLLDEVSGLEKIFDYMLIDTAPGIDENVLYLNSAAEEIFVVVTPDPASLADSYALIKVLNQRYHETRFSIVCNFVKSENEGLRVFKALSDVASRFLCVSLDYKGAIPWDKNLRAATQSQQLITRTMVGSPASQAIVQVSRKLSDIDRLREPKGGIQFFWKHLSGVA